MKRVQAVIFDMDGLMVDTEPLARLSWEKALADYDYKYDEAIFEQVVGLRREDSARVILKAAGLNISLAEILWRKESYLVEIMDQGIPLMPGLKQLVKELASRNIPWAVATSSPLAYAKDVLERIGLIEVCRAIASGEEVDHGKPEPDVYLLAAERLAIAPGKCLALEDSALGAHAAVAAGMQTAAVPNGHTVGVDFSFVDCVFDSLSDVTNALDRLLAGDPN